MKKKTTQPFLGATTNFKEAFPEVESLELVVEQDPYGYYCKRASQRSSRFLGANVQRHMSCVNPRCQQGGLDLQSIISFYEAGTYKFSCNGHEGTPAGRRKGDPCDNVFSVQLSVKRAAAK